MSNSRRTRVRTRGGYSSATQQNPRFTADINEAIVLSGDEDDIMISSPRSFAEARNNSRRNRNLPEVVDLDPVNEPILNNNVPRQQQEMNLESRSSNSVRRQQEMNFESRSSNSVRQQQEMNLERRSSNSTRYGGFHLSRPRAPPPPPPPAPRNPVVTCPICMGPFVETVATKCGHIFCRTCINRALDFKKKCPVCRSKVTMKGVTNVYLPMAD